MREGRKKKSNAGMKVITRYGNTLNLLTIHVVSAAFCRLPDSLCIFQSWYLCPEKRNLGMTLGATPPPSVAGSGPVC